MGRKWRKEARVTVKMEPAQKQQLQQLAWDFGMSTSMFVRILIGQSIKHDSFMLSRVMQPRRGHVRIDRKDLDVRDS